jgi:biopolymer transport protein ExbB
MPASTCSLNSRCSPAAPISEPETATSTPGTPGGLRLLAALLAVPACALALPAGAAAPMDPFALATQGGWTMLLILLASVLMLAISIERLLRLGREKVMPGALLWQVRGLLGPHQRGELEARLKSQPSTLARVLSAALARPHASNTERQASASALASRELREHLRRIQPLAVIAGICPILGLLGTVIGMIESFHAISSSGAMGDPAVLAGGISKALVTTAAGLMVALPALGLYHGFRYRIHAYAAELEQRVGAFIDELPNAEAAHAD